MYVITRNTDVALFITVIKLTVAKSHIFRVLSSEAETSSFESEDQDTSEIP